MDDIYKRHQQDITSLPLTTLNAIKNTYKFMPINTPDYDMDYSLLLQQYIIYRKTQNADARILNFFTSVNLKTLYESQPRFFVYVDKNLKEAREELELPILQVQRSMDPDDVFSE